MTFPETATMMTQTQDIPTDQLNYHPRNCITPHITP